MKIPELLAPAGNFERLETALRFGADAVYLGMQAMSLRNFADNFTLDQLHEACRLAHGMGKRIYVTVNAFARNAEFASLPAFLQDLQAAGVDALIVNDPGVIRVCREFVPHMKLHLSTQANTLNVEAALFWHEQGISRIVLARELTLKEIQEIREEAPHTLELEMFVHGAMCVSYSGRCLFSNYINGRDSNRGECAQPCRWAYEVREATTKGSFYPVEQDEKGTYIFNAKDLNLLKHIPDICHAGVQSLKIEGRMKTIYYVAGVVNAYRMALDKLAAEGALPPGLCGQLEGELEKVSHRPYTTGFAFGNPNEKGQEPNSAQYLQTHQFSAVVLAKGQGELQAYIEQRNRFAVGDTLELFSPGNIDTIITVKALETGEGEQVPEAIHPMEKLLLTADSPLRPGDILRKRLENSASLEKL